MPFTLEALEAIVKLTTLEVEGGHRLELREDDEALVKFFQLQKELRIALEELTPQQNINEAEIIGLLLKQGKVTEKIVIKVISKVWNRFKKELQQDPGCYSPDDLRGWGALQALQKAFAQQNKDDDRVAQIDTELSFLSMPIYLYTMRFMSTVEEAKRLPSELLKKKLIQRFRWFNGELSKLKINLYATELEVGAPKKSKNDGLFNGAAARIVRREANLGLLLGWLEFESILSEEEAKKDKMRSQSDRAINLNRVKDILTNWKKLQKRNSEEISKLLNQKDKPAFLECNRQIDAARRAFIALVSQSNVSQEFRSDLLLLTEDTVSAVQDAKQRKPSAPTRRVKLPLLLTDAASSPPEDTKRSMPSAIRVAQESTVPVATKMEQPLTSSRKSKLPLVSAAQVPAAYFNAGSRSTAAFKTPAEDLLQNKPVPNTPENSSRYKPY